MNMIGSYKNGNYTVTIYDDGTKVRENDLNKLIPDTVESMDIKITNCCDMGCVMCHEDSRPDGKHADILATSFIDKLHPYTELAIGGGNPLSHPHLEAFLVKCKALKLIPSMTVNQKHFMENYEYIKELIDRKLIYGLGISLNHINDVFINTVKTIPNAVIHVINGLVTMPQLDELARNNLKILILGYKEFRRGEKLYAEEEHKAGIDALKNDLYNYLPEIINQSWFNVVSFDNLAIKQLDVKRCMPESTWNEFYMGDDGFTTMYVDMVNKQFARSSTAALDKRYPLMETVEEMFEVLKHE